jgi:hypothetical protein
MHCRKSPRSYEACRSTANDRHLCHGGEAIPVLLHSHHGAKRNKGEALYHTCGHSRRLAFAAQSPFNERMANFFFRYHPQPHPTAVFLEVADARTWLTTAAPQPSLS